jgi:hypothetical protein
VQKNYESVISKYKTKVDEAKEVKSQLKILEDRNIMYMQQNMDLEEVGVATGCVT